MEGHSSHIPSSACVSLLKVSVSVGPEPGVPGQTVCIPSLHCFQIFSLTWWSPEKKSSSFLKTELRESQNHRKAWPAPVAVLILLCGPASSVPRPSVCIGVGGCSQGMVCSLSLPPSLGALSLRDCCLGSTHLFLLSLISCHFPLM